MKSNVETKQHRVSDHAVFPAWASHTKYVTPFSLSCRGKQACPELVERTAGGQHLINT